MAVSQEALERRAAAILNMLLLLLLLVLTYYCYWGIVSVAAWRRRMSSCFARTCITTLRWPVVHCSTVCCYCQFAAFSMSSLTFWPPPTQVNPFSQIQLTDYGFAASTSFHLAKPLTVGEILCHTECLKHLESLRLSVRLLVFYW